MRAIILGLIIAPTAGASELHAQVDFNARVGVTWATALIRDDIIEEVELRQKLAPTLALGASLPIAPRYEAGLELTLTSSGYRAIEGLTGADLGTVRTGTVTLGLHGPVSGAFDGGLEPGCLATSPAKIREFSGAAAPPDSSWARGWTTDTR